MDPSQLTQKELRDIDIYRQTPIRFLGYANEIGEAFRSVVHVSLVRLTYVISIGYVCADALDKSRKAYKLQYPSAKDRRQEVTTTAVDALVWQGFASVVIPGFTINRVCALSNALLRRTTIGTPISKAITTIIGLSTIPFIVHPIDAFVEHAMEKTIRPYYPKPAPLPETAADRTIFT
jgi:fission process protein 1|uniref:Mitochondrial fission process protein 1 n=1 Tax=Panagrolaimus sp. PS1159 TaxID=55785 RepID=A0AC35GRB5_9BILA